MAPSAGATSQGFMAKKLKMEHRNFGSREVTPTGSQAARSNMGKDESSELASVFRSDLTSIRGLVTCSICDQLLYEPWTLSCGHTYCYSCLCSWFVPNKYKKSCPDCRTKIKQMPAPSFMIRQMVEIFTKRNELMPADETVEQHTKKRSEEMEIVDQDRRGADGLFKGIFSGLRLQLFRDEEDGVLRCSGCGFEHEGGPMCVHCHELLDEDGPGFSDAEDADLEDLQGQLEDLEQDLADDSDVDEELVAHHPAFALPGFQFDHGLVHGDYESSAYDDSDLDEAIQEEYENDGFVVPDDDDSPAIRAPRMGHLARNREPIEISDDESDEGGPITNSRARRVPNRGSPDINAREFGDAPSESDTDDVSSEAEMLRQAGWSPLHQGEESEVEERPLYSYNGRPIRVDLSDDSDTDTTIGHETEQELDFENRRGAPAGYLSSVEFNGYSDSEADTPRYQHNGEATPGRYSHTSTAPPTSPSPSEVEEFYGYGRSGDIADDDDSDNAPESRDGDGDTEMSVSSRRSLEMANYPAYPRSSSGESQSSELDEDEDEDFPQNTHRGIKVERGSSIGGEFKPERESSLGGESLGNNHIIQRFKEEAEESSDDDIRGPPSRRRPRQPEVDLVHSGENSAERHLRELYDNEELDVSNILGRGGGLPRDRQYNVARPSQYRNRDGRKWDPLRSTRSPSVTRVIASSSRSGRNQRRYVDGYHR